MVALGDEVDLGGVYQETGIGCTNLRDPITSSYRLCILWNQVRFRFFALESLIFWIGSGRRGRIYDVVALQS